MTAVGLLAFATIWDWDDSVIRPGLVGPGLSSTPASARHSLRGLGATLLVIGITVNSPPLPARPLKACHNPPRQCPKWGDHATPRLAREEEHSHLQGPITESYTNCAGCRIPTPPGGWLLETLGREHKECGH